MKPWYRNSTLQMDDPEMIWLQQQDPATCAVWEWVKSRCQKSGTSKFSPPTEFEIEVVAMNLGLPDSPKSSPVLPGFSQNLPDSPKTSPVLPDSPKTSQNLPESPRLSQILQRLQKVGWIKNGEVRGWDKWQRERGPEEDALRKQVDYWRSKAQGLMKVSPVSPKTSPVLPDSPKSSPSEERRGEEIRGEERERETPPPPQGGFAETPSWEEFWGYAQMHHPAPEWYVKDKFLAAEQKNWIGIPKWTIYVQRIQGWWKQDGSPMHSEKKVGGNGKSAYISPDYSKGFFGTKSDQSKPTETTVP